MGEGGGRGRLVGGVWSGVITAVKRRKTGLLFCFVFKVDRLKQM